MTLNAVVFYRTCMFPTTCPPVCAVTGYAVLLTGRDMGLTTAT